VGADRITCMFGSVPVDFGGYGRGGVAIHTGKIAEALTAAGEKVTVLAPDVPTRVDRQNENLPRIARTAPFDTIGYSQPRKTEAIRLLLRGRQIGPSRELPRAVSLGWKESMWLRPISYRYFQLIQPLYPDIVHVHGGGLTALAVQRAAARSRSALVLTVHSLRGHGPDDVFFRRVVPSLFVADAVITVSRHLKTEASSYGVDAARIHVIPNGVDRSYFAPVSRESARRSLALKQDPPVVLLVGHLIERKGADIAIRSMRSVVAQCPSAKLYLIGGPQDYTDPDWLERVRRLPRELGIEENVVFVGDIPGHADGLLNLWYNAADVVVLPSRAEGMGMVLTEAMACGTPVIGSRVGGIPDVIAEGSTGLLVPPENPDALGVALLEILTNRALAARLSEASTRYVANEHDWNAIARRTQAVYAEALSRRRR
jgi:glycosyltransferase involved in cell wall biosynthesis